ncbi:hypothetical protein MPSEU_000747900 [Mayamaea pseudoterrestris]|nr:hypothetical protein MPSEU_000747900 [Mayamaea pseudoterrestris]
MAPATASSSRVLTVKLPDDLPAENYVLRGLDESEMPQWSAFCASVFAYKDSPPPAAYFERHYCNDPDRRASFVRVACRQLSNEIVASCRIFVRHISTAQCSVYSKNLKKLKAGGIGEVCTSANHRKRNLSKELLKDCFDIMKEENFHVSFLHSGPAFFPVYQSAGYECVRTKWTHLPIRSQSSTGCYDALFRIRTARFPQDTEQLMQIYQDNSEHNFEGCIIRSKEYWEQYVAQELGESLLVVEEGNTILGWISLRERGNVIQLREFGLADKSTTQAASTGCHVGMLLHKALEGFAGKSQVLAMPTLVYERILHEWGPSVFNLLDSTNVTTEDDMGWMYKSFHGHSPPNGDSHLIWPSDSF